MVRRGLRAWVAAGLALALVGCSSTLDPRPTWTVVSNALTNSVGAGPPAPGASGAVVDVTVRLLAGERTPGRDNWQVVPLSDVGEGHAVVERARPYTNSGVVAVRGRGATAVAIAVPIPGGEAPAERLGVDLFVRTRALALVVAGGPDAAASPEAPFRAVTDALGERGLVVTVVEGYAPDAAPDTPEVVLQGATDRPSDEELRLGTVLQAAGVQVCVLVGEECHDPGVALQQLGDSPAGPVVRVQLAGRLASDAGRRDAVVAELAKALDDL